MRHFVMRYQTSILTVLTIVSALWPYKNRTKMVGQYGDGNRGEISPIHLKATCYQPNFISGSDPLGSEPKDITALMNQISDGHLRIKN